MKMYKCFLSILISFMKENLKAICFAKQIKNKIVAPNNEYEFHDSYCDRFSKM